ncbi:MULTISPECIES: L,D-transpeptidase [Bradyrhizobium]|uniref:L,D-transpeptidase n=1 Tax=Bradyrhizobium TaxID=374 RepID=UPI0008418523|nr:MULTISPECIES: L,D-transpeptidase [Bradyrhizobium]MBP2427058.1 lipoprotein-anchoring transpeptidase ErfK/SrfK [Bradyrhizobium elkanii]MCP1931263.1 lipoprotein-anchoring transpeptidase ErfK/SrfK [Bradyrhizobium elkanii]MCP1970254.1 lipoprotein-anchoring transpeptidase ErfK/SrfK [Bradyrhizobium elkanii]MCS3480612.1 lipoprotein-anchoring transpeptidase ErfK/SrfK [Bradyrhizobium elkanii]MCS3517419.1 lipoprotein-anchoring transpeptidase ErfK/SrfK [Bradyrhizobium elkanii]
MRAGGRRISIFDVANERFWQLAILTTAGTVAASTQADAALYYWNRDSAFYGDYEPMPLPQPHRQKPKRNAAKKNPAIEKEAGSKPQGPLIISVSIDQQRVSLYDANGLYAESPVSTGMKGHSTPMGVFSVIQKQKYHQSNIYSGAPMPYMQRITWSGIAMHAGVLPGYPASHGCIRMPMSFAVKMYNWTRMGARVFVTPGTISPESFSHPLLVTQKVAPQQPVADDILKMDAPLGVKSDKGADKPQTGLDLRTSVGHAAASLRDNTHTADASSAMPAASASVTMSDASSSTARDAIAEKIAADKSETVKAETAAADKPAEANSAVRDSNRTTDDRTVGETTASTDTPKTEVSASDPVKAEAKADEPKEDAAKPAEAATAADAPDAKKDPARLPGTARIDVPKRAGQIAVFISRKDSKLYVRQNFAPLFEVPVTIAASDRPLGTHVFTAQVDKTDANLLRWSVVTLPTRNTARIDVEERASHRRKVAAAAVAEAKPQPVTNSPAEALDRISIPADVMARISEALGTGGSIIVSDLGVNQGETGEGTDFILPLR